MFYEEIKAAVNICCKLEGIRKCKEKYIFKKVRLGVGVFLQGMPKP